MIAEEGAEGDWEHGGDEEEKENVELTMSLTCSHISPELQQAEKSFKSSNKWIPEMYQNTKYILRRPYLHFFGNKAKMQNIGSRVFFKIVCEQIKCKIHIRNKGNSKSKTERGSGPVGLLWQNPKFDLSFWTAHLMLLIWSLTPNLAIFCEFHLKKVL